MVPKTAAPSSQPRRNGKFAPSPEAKTRTRGGHRGRLPTVALTASEKADKETRRAVRRTLHASLRDRVEQVVGAIDDALAPPGEGETGEAAAWQRERRDRMARWVGDHVLGAGALIGVHGMVLARHDLRSLDGLQDAMIEVLARTVSHEFTMAESNFLRDWLTSLRELEVERQVRELEAEVGRIRTSIEASASGGPDIRDLLVSMTKAQDLELRAYDDTHKPAGEATSATNGAAVDPEGHLMDVIRDEEEKA